MFGNRARRVGCLATVCLGGLIVVPLRAGQPKTFRVLARHDMPGPVSIQVQAWNRAGTLVAEETLSWTNNNNAWSWETALVSRSAATYRFTFLYDQCDPGCPEDPDADRNAHIDRFSVAGLWGAEDFHLTGGTHPQSPGCSVETVDGRVTATCDDEGDWVEYTFPARDILIVDTTRRNAIFGMYRLSQMTQPGWDLFARTVDWAITYDDHTTTQIWLATYNGTLDPESDEDGLAAYDYLVGTMGFSSENINVASQGTIETGDFTGYDLVLYANTYAQDATNVLNQGVPFVTTSVGEADEMGIGTGEAVMHWTRTDAFVVDNSHDVTSTYPLGLFTLSDYMWMDATVASGNGRVLVDAYGIGDCDVECKDMTTGSVAVTDRKECWEYCIDTCAGIQQVTSCDFEGETIITNIPAVTEWGMVVMVLLVLTAGTVVIRRLGTAAA